MSESPVGPVADQGAAPEDTHPEYKATYAYLRAGIVVLVAMLAVAIAIDTVANHGLRGSISAYYYSTAQTIFVGVLAGIGISMIAYQGNLESEDHLLNFSGVMAFLVAAIPTPNAGTVSPDLIRTSVWAIVIGFGLAIAANWYILKRFPFPQKELLAKVAATAIGVWLVVYAALLVVNPEALARWGHPFAAVPMFLAIILVAVLNALGTSQPKYRNWYVAVAIAIPVGLLGVLAGVLFAGLSSGVFFAEVVVILSFAVFWTVQTIELTTRAKRVPKAPGESPALDALTKG